LKEAKASNVRYQERLDALEERIAKLVEEKQHVENELDYMRVRTGDKKRDGSLTPVPVLRQSQPSERPASPPPLELVTKEGEGEEEAKADSNEAAAAGDSATGGSELVEATPIQAMEAEDSQEQDAKNRENMRVRSFIPFFLACMESALRYSHSRFLSLSLSLSLSLFPSFFHSTATAQSATAPKSAKDVHCRCDAHTERGSLARIVSSGHALMICLWLRMTPITRAHRWSAL
jgi:hypothetical protein